MSFSSRTKEELCQLRIKKNCCRLAALSAFIQMAGSLQLAGGGKKRLRMNSESYTVARWCMQLGTQSFPVEAQVLVREHKRLGKNRSFSIVFGGAAIDDLMTETGLLNKTEEGYELTGGVPEFVEQNECCRRAFLRGAYLGSGSLSDPAKGYHLEFVARSEAMAEGLWTLLEEYDLNAKLMLRKGNSVVYLKESEKITEFLTLIGASGAILELENVKVYKDFRNNLNRQVNCETANIQKTVTAASRQVENIRYLINSGVFNRLPQSLREAAEVRVNNPDATLKELGEMLCEPVSKSGMNHRLRKLDEIALQMRIEKGDSV
jgi:DNA-binding protein WhiA